MRLFGMMRDILHQLTPRQRHNFQVVDGLVDAASYFTTRS
jgi:hypothetical protein